MCTPHIEKFLLHKEPCSKARHSSASFSRKISHVVAMYKIKKQQNFYSLYLNDTIRFDASSKGPSSGISIICMYAFPRPPHTNSRRGAFARNVEYYCIDQVVSRTLLLFDVVICYLHWPHIEIGVKCLLLLDGSLLCNEMLSIMV